MNPNSPNRQQPAVTAQNAPSQTEGSDSSHSQQSPWMSHPSLKNIDPARLQLLSSLASQAQGKNKNELLPFLMAAASQTGSGQLSFASDEIDAIIQVLKIGKSPEEIQQIDRLCTLIKQFRQTNR